MNSLPASHAVAAEWRAHPLDQPCKSFVDGYMKKSHILA
jgi:hypothetical protein